MEERTGPDGRIVLAGTRNCVETPGFAPDAIVYKELTLIGALGVDAPAYRKALDLVGSDRYPFRSISRVVAPLADAADLLEIMARRGVGAAARGRRPGALAGRRESWSA